MSHWSLIIRASFPSHYDEHVFQLRKVTGEWLIDSAGTMDTNRRR